VLVDVQPATGQLDPAQAAEAITSRTRAIIASHLHGGVVNMAALRSVADEHGLAIVEDACQTPGAPLGARRAGMHGDVGVISFGGSKLLSAGRGGAILTNRLDIAARIRRYGFRGNAAYPLSELQAAVLLPQLDQLDARRAERRSRAAELFAGLADCPILTPLGEPSAFSEPDYYKVGFHYHAGACGGLSRDVFAAAMQAEGIAVFPGFRGLHRLHARSRFRQAGDLPESTRADSGWLVLHHPVLLSGTEAIGEIIAAVHKVQHHADRLREAKLRGRGPTSPWEGEP
jgi:dTDP-4-amino-4,6-dideoxygalactose transaminase